MNTWKDKTEFKECVHDYAEKMGIKIKALYLREMTTKWASCSTDGNLNFNSELLGLEKDLGKFAIVHELLHFKIPNHGKLWKSLMTAYLGDWEKLDNRLRAIYSASAVMAPAAKLGTPRHKTRI
jgi:predicted metal-dependent hydrolase